MTNSSRSKREVGDLKPGDSIEMYVIASNEGWEWVAATVLEVEPLRIRWWDGEEKAWTREGARIPMIRTPSTSRSMADQQLQELCSQFEGYR